MTPNNGASLNLCFIGQHIAKMSGLFILAFSKKLRACTACYVQYNAPTEEVRLEGDLEDQSVEIPKRHFIGKAGSMLDTSNISIASSTASISGNKIFVLK